jgi:hypothetical protein
VLGVKAWGVAACTSMDDHVLQRIKALLLLCCGLTIAALAGWGGFAYQASAAHRASAQAANLVANRNAMKEQRDAALYKLEQLQKPPANLTQINARLEALGAEYNRLWDLAKVKRLEAAKAVDYIPTGTIQKAPPAARAR